MTVRRAKYIAQANFDDLLREQRKASKGYGKMATAAEAASQSMSRSAGKTAAAQSALPLKAATAATAAERMAAARQYGNRCWGVCAQKARRVSAFAD